MSESTVITGNALEVLSTLPEESVQCCVTSPPYWRLVDYEVDGQIGLEESPWELVENLVRIFRGVRHVLRRDGTLWVNVGDSYCGSGGAGGDFDRAWIGRQRTARPGTPGHLKPKDLAGFPWILALALQEDGWWLRCDVVWEKYSRGESAKDRPPRNHEYLFLLARARRNYIFDRDALPVQSSVWRIYDRSGVAWHPATFPEALVVPCVRASTPAGGTVLDPFAGSGTVGVVCSYLERDFIGIELNPDFAEGARRRIESPITTCGVPNEVEMPLFG